MISVLVVDDDPHLRKLTVFALGLDDAFEITECESGEDALARIAERKFDIVLLDLDMPGIGGRAAARRITQEHPGVDVVMLTGKEKVDLDGVRGILRKPFDPVSLAAEVRRITER